MTSPLSLNYCTIPHHSVVKSLAEAAQVLLAKLYWHRNARTGQLNPKHATLSRELGWSVSKVRNHIRTLREAGIIRATKGRRGNRYEIQPAESWRKPVKAPNCKPLKTPCVVNSGRPELARQDGFILYERETILLNERSGAAAVSSGVVGERGEANAGGGGSPAAPNQDVRKAIEGPGSSCEPGVSLANSGENPNPPAPTRDSRPQMREQNRKLAPEIADKAQALVTELLPLHPQPGNPTPAAAEIGRVLAEGVTVDEIRASHLQWRKMWAVYRIGRFIPQLWRWIRDNDWRHAPTEQQIQAARDPDRVDEAKMERLKAAVARSKAEEEVAKAKQKRRDEISWLKDVIAGNFIDYVPTPEAVEKAKIRLAELRREAAA